MRPHNAPPNATSTSVTTEPLLRTRDVLTRLSISRKTLDRLIAAGRLPVIRLGKDYRFDPAALRHLETASTIGLTG